MSKLKIDGQELAARMLFIFFVLAIWFVLFGCNKSPQTEQEVSVAAFNIQIFGQKKSTNSEIMKQLAKVGNKFSVLLIQEIRDAKGQTAERFQKVLNNQAGFEKYAFTKSSRLGRSNSKEVYAFFYDTNLLYLEDELVYFDKNDKFEREPYIAYFMTKDKRFDFILIGIHIKPKDVRGELVALGEVIRFVQEEYPNEKDIVLLGDFNADKPYFTESSKSEYFDTELFNWVISDEEKTTVKTGKTYDRIVIMRQGLENREYVANSADVLDLTQFLNISLKEAAKLSDHNPVYAIFKPLKEDDD